MDLVFVRHAESLGNAQGRWQGRLDSELTDLGRRQAARLRERFASEGFEPTHIYSSPLSRTHETARIVSADWDHAIAPLDDLMEIDVGVFEGKTWDEIEREFPDLARQFAETRDWDLVPGAETLGQRRGRALAAVTRLIADHSNGDRVLAFTHGGIIQHLFAVLMDSQRLWGMSVRNTALFEFTLDVDRWNQNGSAITNSTLWRIIRFNDASHLG
jgi:broad specificity phosphatase PhoE